MPHGWSKCIIKCNIHWYSVLLLKTEKSTRKLEEWWYGCDAGIKKGLYMHMKMTRWRWYMSFMGNINLVKQTFSSVLQDK